VWEEVLLGEGGEEFSLSTSLLRFKAMVLLVGKFEVMCPYPKHLIHFIELVLVPWEELGVSLEGLDELVLGDGSWELLGGDLSCFLSLPFQVLE